MFYQKKIHLKLESELLVILVNRFRHYFKLYATAVKFTLNIRLSQIGIIIILITNNLECVNKCNINAFIDVDIMN